MQNTIHTFPNGLKLAHQKLPYVRSVAVGIFFGVGSANETEEDNGISHFIEHMLFKGTKTRSAFRIVEELEGIGAQVNAYTSKQVTCYYTVSVDDQVEKCVTVLQDMLLNSLFDEGDIEKEKGVVTEEIAMCDDDPSDVCLELCSKLYFNGGPLGRPILGSRENVRSFTRERIIDYMAKHYGADRCCISIVGNIDLDRAKELAEKYFVGTLPSCKVKEWKDEPYETKGSFDSVLKDLEQANISLAFRGYKMRGELEPALSVVNSVLAGGMCSRLFQEVREKLGLAYSVYGYPNTYINNGYYNIYLGTNPSSAEKALKAIKEQIDLIKSDFITREEFDRAKRQLKGSYIIGQESSSVIMRAIAKHALCLDKTFDIDELIADIDSVEFDNVKRVINEVFDYSKMSFAYVGKKQKNDIYKIFV